MNMYGINKHDLLISDVSEDVKVKQPLQDILGYNH